MGHFKFISLPALLVAASLVSGCTPKGDDATAAFPPRKATTTTTTSNPSSTPASTSSTTSAPSTTAGPTKLPAKVALEALAVKGRAAKTGYSREQFPHWKDTDGDGCNADDQAVKLRANVELKNRCREVAATMTDPYSGKELRWGTTRTKIVDIDHVSALGDVWVKGGQGLSIKYRQAVANDQMNLLPVDATLNRQKGDGDAATWMPPLKSFHCEYATRQVAVKTRYNLWVTQAEKDALNRALDTCSQDLTSSLPWGGVAPWTSVVK